MKQLKVTPSVFSISRQCKKTSELVENFSKKRIFLRVYLNQTDRACWEARSQILYNRGVKLIFTGGHISLTVAFKGPNVILGLYKCNYSSSRGKELGTATR